MQSPTGQHNAPISAQGTKRRLRSRQECKPLGISLSQPIAPGVGTNFKPKRAKTIHVPQDPPEQSQLHPQPQLGAAEEVRPPRRGTRLQAQDPLEIPLGEASRGAGPSGLGRRKSDSEQPSQVAEPLSVDQIVEFGGLGRASGKTSAEGQSLEHVGGRRGGLGSNPPGELKPQLAEPRLPAPEQPGFCPEHECGARRDPRDQPRARLPADAPLNLAARAPAAVPVAATGRELLAESDLAGGSKLPRPGSERSHAAQLPELFSAAGRHAAASVGHGGCVPPVLPAEVPALRVHRPGGATAAAEPCSARTMVGGGGGGGADPLAAAFAAVPSKPHSPVARGTKRKTRAAKLGDGLGLGGVDELEQLGGDEQQQQLKVGYLSTLGSDGEWIVISSIGSILLQHAKGLNFLELGIYSYPGKRIWHKGE